MSDDDIEKIVRELQQLNLRQTQLLNQLDRLRVASPPAVSPTTAARDFRIGDRVRIKNPRLLQPSTGTVIKIGPSRITVQTASGSTIVRAQKNLELIR